MFDEIKSLNGELKIIGDKSISHRAIILSSIGDSKVEIENILLSDDIYRTIDCFRRMGVEIVVDESLGKIIVDGVGLNGLKEPIGELYCGNSGTTMRLLSGLLAGQNFPSILRGDESLEKRPMNRIIEPISFMGGKIESNNGLAPLKIYPSDGIKPIVYNMPVDSAQVKSAIHLLSLYSTARSEVFEKHQSRDHTERMLDYFYKNNWAPSDIHVPGDISSASFLIVGALVLEGSHIVLRDVGVNPSRTGILDVLSSMGGDIRIFNERVINNEPVADIEVKYSKMTNIEIGEELMGRLIDEIPIISIAGLYSEGKLIVSGGSELRVKETDRIRVLVDELSKVGAKIIEKEDGFILEGNNELMPATLNSHDDHRMAMAFSILGLSIGDGFSVDNLSCIDISYPSFLKDILYNL